MYSLIHSLAYHSSSFLLLHSLSTLLLSVRSRPVTKGETLFSTLKHLGKNFVRRFLCGQIFPFKLDQYRKGNPFYSNHVRDTEDVFTVLVNDGSRA